MISSDPYKPIPVLYRRMLRLTEVKPLSKETASKRRSQDLNQKAEPQGLRSEAKRKEKAGWVKDGAGRGRAWKGMDETRSTGGQQKRYMRKGRGEGENSAGKETDRHGGKAATHT